MILIVVLSARLSQNQAVPEHPVQLLQKRRRRPDLRQGPRHCPHTLTYSGGTDDGPHHTLPSHMAAAVTPLTTKRTLNAMLP